MAAKAFAALADDGQYVVDLKPPEDDVQVSSRPLVLPMPIAQLDLAKPAEEQEQVALADTLRGEVALCCARLSKCRKPAPRMLSGRPIELRIQVHAGFAAPAISAQVSQQGVKRNPLESEVAHRVGIMQRRDGEGQQPTIGQDRTRDSAVLGVEALS